MIAADHTVFNPDGIAVDIDGPTVGTAAPGQGGIAVDDRPANHGALGQIRQVESSAGGRPIRHVLLRKPPGVIVQNLAVVNRQPAVADEKPGTVPVSNNGDIAL